jgi:recombination protein RecT
VVRDGDKFIYKTGLTTILEHEPNLDGIPGDIRLAYAVCELTDGGFHVEVMTRWKIERIRDNSPNVIAARKFGKQTPWDTDTEEMFRKTVLRRICKYLPKSPELETAIALDETPHQSLSVDDAINGTWAPASDDEEPQTVESIETVDTKTGEIVTETKAVEEPEDPFLELRQNPEYADWFTSVDDCNSMIEFSELVNTMPKETKTAMRAFLMRRRDEIKGVVARAQN